MWWREDLVSQLRAKSELLGEDLLAQIAQVKNLGDLIRLESPLPARPGRVLRIVLQHDPGRSVLEVRDVHVDEAGQSWEGRSKPLATVPMEDIVGAIHTAKVGDLDLEVVLVEGMAYHPTLRIEVPGAGFLLAHFTEVDSPHILLGACIGHTKVIDEDGERCLVMPSTWPGSRVLLGSDPYGMRWCGTVDEVRRACNPAKEFMPPDHDAPVYKEPENLLAAITAALAGTDE